MNKLPTFLILVSVCWTIPVVSQEPAEKFVEALRENGYFDIALEYLKDLETNGMAPPEFKKVLPFERAETLIKSTAQLRDINAWEERLDEAERLLKQFASSADTDESVARAERYRGNLLFKRAKIYSHRSESDRLTAQEKSGLLDQTRSFLQQSLEAYNTARTTLKTVLENFQVDPEDPNSRSNLKRLQGIYTQIRVRIPMVTEQLADTYPDDHPTRKKQLKEATEQYIHLWDTYSRYPAGLDSGLFAARCMYKQGQFNDALMQLQEIFALSNNSAFKVLKRKALVLACDCWERVEPFPADEIIKRCGPQVEVLTRQEEREPDWLKIRLSLARAYKAKADEMAATKQTGAAGQAKTFNRDAARLAKAISRIPSEYQDQAKQLLDQWNVSFTVEEAKEAPPATFAEAKTRCQDLVAEVESVSVEIGELKNEVAATADATRKAELQVQLDQAELRLKQQVETALKSFDLALGMVEQETLREDINKIRYFQCFCYFANRDYFETALVGEWLMARYPKVNWTRQSAALVVKAYLGMLQEAEDGDREFEQQHLTSVCDTIIKTWPGTNEAGIAAGTMTRLHLSEKEVATAEKYFAEIPTDSMERPSLSVQLGNRLWFDYRGENPDTASPLLAKAKRYLQEGLEATGMDRLSFRDALAALLLVEAYLENNEVDLAVKRLEADTIAPLDLVKQKHPVIRLSTDPELFTRETYRVAVKTYLAAMKGSKEQQKWIAKAQGIIAAMQEETDSTNDPAARQRLTTIYRLIASQLKKQFAALNSIEDKSKFATNIRLFLQSIEQNATDARTLLWAGGTLLDVATDLKQNEALDAAAPLFKQAVSALDRAEKLKFGNDKEADKLEIELQRLRGLALRGTDRYEPAIREFTEILKKSPSNLTVQINAAETLQMWGKFEKRSKHFAEAMMGKEKVKSKTTGRTTNLIWGWRKLVTATKDNEQFASTFNLALFNLIEARFEYGLIEKSDKAISASLKELANARRRDATLGGPDWRTKFEALETRIKQHVN